MRRIRLRLGLMFAVVAVPIVLASAAYACQSLASLFLNPRTAEAADTVTFSGYNYSTASGASRVEIHWRTRSGRLLASVVPDGTRKISGTFRVPSVAPGDYMVLATQTVTGSDGVTRPVSGTPGRAALRVVRTSSGTAAAFIPSSGKGSRPDLALGHPLPAPAPNPAMLFLALAGIATVLLASTYWKLSGRAVAAAPAV